ncbi:hypothetical protein [Nocardiopsis sp. CNR-923]|nr:hypothetical protein [Nocardiopsis sp. CNR-923]
MASAADYLRAGSTADPAAIAERGWAAGVDPASTRPGLWPRTA